jgi:hypothetical protein
MESITINGRKVYGGWIDITNLEESEASDVIENGMPKLIGAKVYGNNNGIHYNSGEFSEHNYSFKLATAVRMARFCSLAYADPDLPIASREPDRREDETSKFTRRCIRASIDPLRTRGYFVGNVEAGTNGYVFSLPDVILVCFRGVEWDSVDDVKSNWSADLKPWTFPEGREKVSRSTGQRKETETKAGSGVTVHAGYMRQWESVRTEVLGIVGELLQARDQKSDRTQVGSCNQDHIYVTGKSQLTLKKRQKSPSPARSITHRWLGVACCTLCSLLLSSTQATPWEQQWQCCVPSRLNRQLIVESFAMLTAPIAAAVAVAAVAAAAAAAAAAAVALILTCRLHRCCNFTLLAALLWAMETSAGDSKL